jgi:hypothetical protein
MENRPMLHEVPDRQDLLVRLMLALFGLTVILLSLYRWAT